MRTPVALLLAASLAVPAPAGAAPGGPTWTVTHDAEVVGWDSLTAFAGGTGWAIHDSVDDGTAGDAFLRTGDFGATWTAVAPPAGVRPASMAMNTATSGFALAVPLPRHAEDRPSVYDGGILATNDGWRTMRRHPLPRPRDVRTLLVTQMSAAPGGRSAVLTGSPWAPGGDVDGVEVVWIADGGRTTRRTRLEPRHGHVATVSVLDDRNAVVAVERTLPFTDPPPVDDCCRYREVAVYVTDDAGRSWRRTAVIPREIAYSVDYVAPGHIVVPGYEGDVHVSRDGGRRFATVGTVRLFPRADWTHPPVPTVDFVTPQVGYAHTCLSGMWRTTDGGETWDLETSPNHGNVVTQPTCHWGRSVAAFDADHAVAVTFGGFLTRTAR